MMWYRVGGISHTLMRVMRHSSYTITSHVVCHAHGVEGACVLFDVHVYVCVCVRMYVRVCRSRDVHVDLHQMRAVWYVRVISTLRERTRCCACLCLRVRMRVWPFCACLPVGGTTVVSVCAIARKPPSSNTRH